jgi:hypothetical protein
MILVVGIMASAALTYANASLHASNSSIEPDRNSEYAADGALGLATKYLESNASVGVAGGTTCGNSASFSSVVSLPATGSAPAVDVQCQPSSTSGTMSGSGTGAITDTMPANSILALGTRNAEPGPLNNSPLDAATVYDTNAWGERGIDLQKSSTGGNSTIKFDNNIVSNSPVRKGSTSGSLTSTGTISARGACENVSPCTVVPYSTAATADPGYPYRTPTLTQRSVPSCDSGTLVSFQPGWYSSANTLNSLFATCKDHDFWFTPGTYYFDFRDTSGGTQCRPQSGTAADTLHEWCIGPYADSATTVMGGAAPSTWDTSPSQVTSTISTFYMAGTTPQSWNNPNNMVSINGSSSNYSWTSSDTSNTYAGVLWPATPIPSTAASIDSISVDVSSAVTSGAAARTLFVVYGTDLSGFCPTTYPITGNSVTISGLQSCLDTPDKVNTAVLAVAFDPSTSSGNATVDGFRMHVTYTPSPARIDFPGGCDNSATGVQFIFGGDSRMYVSNGSVELCSGPNPAGSTTNQQIAVYGVPPVNPIVPTSAVATSGQNSWTTVTNASNARDIAEQSGLANASIAVTPKCGNNPGQISCSGGSGSGTAYGSMRLTFPANQFTLPANTVLQNVKLRASYNTTSSGAAPQFFITQNSDGSGWNCTADATFGTTSQTSAFVRPVSTACLTAARLNAGFTIEWRARKTVTCSSNNCGSAITQTLDGLEVDVQIDPATSSTAVVMPEDGCISPLPNDYTSGQPLTYEYGPNAWEGDSSPDCPLIKWDAVPRTSGSASQIGCYSGQVSLRGTLYAPGAAIDFDQAGPPASNCSASSPTYTSWSYPIFGRGAVLRTLRIKGMRASAGQTLGTCGASNCGGVAEDRVVTFRARVGGTTKITSRVRFPADGSAPKVETWTVA